VINDDVNMLVGGVGLKVKGTPKERDVSPSALS